LTKPELRGKGVPKLELGNQLVGELGDWLVLEPGNDLITGMLISVPIPWFFIGY